MNIRSFVGHLPWGAQAISLIDARRAAKRLQGQEASVIFTDIYLKNQWGGKDSISGPGSDSDQTQYLVEMLPGVLTKYAIRSILDVPCGDFHWMRSVDLGGRSYLGGDIVYDLVRKNESLYGSPSVQFRKLDLLQDDLPPVDLVFCRDCLVQLSHRDIRAALRNIAGSGSRYLMTTSFIGRKSNSDIMTGQWRPLNLLLEPYSFPEPLEILNEGCTEGGSRYADKSMLLWRIDDLQRFLEVK